MIVCPYMEKNSEDYWQSVAKYTEKTEDSTFVNEVAYMMVTLHRTGA